MSDTRFHPFVIDNAAGQETIAGVGSDQAKYGVGVSSDFIVSGTVGIGTTNPGRHLHLYRDDNNVIGIRLENNEGNSFILADSDALHLDADTTVIRSEAGVTKVRVESNGLVKGTLHTLIGEHSAATAAGQLFSFGNGATDNQGPAMPFAGEVVVVTISKSGGSDAGTFQPSKNGVTQGSASDQITTTTGSGTVTKNNANYSSLMDFGAGDRINYVTIDGTDTTTCLTMFVRFNP